MSIVRVWDLSYLRPWGIIGHALRVICMQNLDSKGQAGSGRVIPIFVWGGVLLLFVGGILAYPYVSSHLTAFPVTPTLDAPSATPIPTTANVSPAETSTPALSHTLAFAPSPPPAPTPALPTRLLIPVIGLDASVVPVSRHTVEVDGQPRAIWDLPEARAVGWHETSAPLGVVGNTVFNGHNTTNGEIFRYLYKLEKGDVVIVFSGDAPYTYIVAEMLILPEAGQPLEVRVENAQYILPTNDERLTLVTCHPYGSLRNRLIVIARPDDVLQLDKSAR